MDGVSDERGLTQSVTHVSHTLVGRDGVIRNMIWRLGRGESLALYSGPGLGKTSLLLELNKRLDEHAIPAHYYDLGVVGSQDILRRDDSNQYDVVLLLDNCDVLVNDPSRIQDVLQRESIPGMVLAGGRSWYGMFCQQDWAKTLRWMPLGVLLDKDASALVRSSRWSEQAELILTHAGTHPHILHLFCQQVGPLDVDMDSTTILSQVGAACEPIFPKWIQQMKEPIEHELLRYLVERAAPVNPQVAARALHQATIKPVADILCWLGLISRCIRNDEATLFANCGMFNTWYMKHVIRQ